MPDLLELIAETDSATLTRWEALFRERAPQIETLPTKERLREWLTLARESSRAAAWAGDAVEGWLAEFQTRLREGMGGEKVRAHLRAGRGFCRLCRMVAKMAGELWQLAEDAGGRGDEIDTARRTIIAIEERLKPVEAEIESIAAVVRPLSPEELEKFFKRAEGQARQGKWLTPEQARAAVLKPE